MALRKVQHGFTLIEVLVAMAISAVIGLLSYSAMSGNINSIEISRQHQQRMSDMQLFFSVLSRDVRQLANREVRSGDFGPVLPPLKTGVAQVNWLELTKFGWHNPMLSNRGELQRVAYRWEGDILYRGQWLVLDGLTDIGYREVELINGVDNIEVNVLSEQGLWQSEWPLQGVITPGKMLEVIITFNDIDEVRRVYALQ
ncbi:Type II secretion system protein J [Sinobacterium norvegicum]|uniref:Type II secretion system protein J n=1 Tax=Sinobacterium norvegicum TaxID=1641715 RepID=A0ABN8EJA4_9GAMM|nr:type II secretion system minor pseudopilin GspJ [Sinobacterium norvegicum]CAH0992495.1 Type II secretion system protein J [Sinobacterium norvegicum]